MANIRQRLNFKINQGLVIVDNFSDQEIGPETIADLNEIFNRTFKPLPKDWSYRLELKIFDFTGIENVFGQAMFIIDEIDYLLADYFRDDDAIKIIINFFHDGCRVLRNTLGMIQPEKKKPAAADNSDKQPTAKTAKTEIPTPPITNSPPNITSDKLGKMFDEL